MWMANEESPDIEENMQSERETEKLTVGETDH